ncbi:methyl-accepting chemotaxis protein [Ureibacillus acetophenoni]|uniref:Methyl-accepting chemotaxis protein n=1 Tax=Ureibacillus acetophenoni TaxID=614649 RepID=A0A285U5L1_9BACL|nr:methyl-accepting chemotaxis protein [Ureibacillus acetophenoni]SOC37122.1 methyl-accepting chemotaxis protein [Ureibacillus acetophenoni]
MKLKTTLTFQLGTIIAGILIVMIAISSVATYITAYDKLYEAAGIEAYGCANITTGLINTDDLNKALDGDVQTSEQLGKTINWTTQHKNIFESQYIVDLNGNLVALDDNLKDKGFAVGDAFHVDEQAIATLIETGHPTYSEPYEFAGLKRLSGYAPIFEDHDSSKEIIAISVIDFDANIVSERTWGVVSQGILISIIPMLLAAVVTALLIRRKTKPISALIHQAKEIAGGNLMVGPTKVKSKDEIGDLANTLNQLTLNLQNMIATMRKTSHQLTENANENASSLEEMTQSVKTVANNIEEVSASMTDGMNHADQASSVLITLAEDLQNMKLKADNTVEVSNNTMQIASEGEVRAKEISNDMEKIRTGSKEVSDTIQQLVQSTTKIQSITNAISDIASQTNLLALNASIEAARAGEHGKGFAVVAEEVRKLAEQSNKEVSQVGNLVKDIMDKIGKVMISSNENEKYIEKGSNTVKLTAKALNNISIAVSDTVKEIATISDLLSSETVKSDNIVEMIQEFTHSIHQIESTITNIAAAAEETTAGIDEISNSSQESTLMAEELEKYVRTFKLKE